MYDSLSIPLQSKERLSRHTTLDDTIKMLNDHLITPSTLLHTGGTLCMSDTATTSVVLYSYMIRRRFWLLLSDYLYD